MWGMIKDPEVQPFLYCPMSLTSDTKYGHSHLVKQKGPRYPDSSTREGSLELGLEPISWEFLLFNPTDFSIRTSQPYTLFSLREALINISSSSLGHFQ